MLLVLLVIPAHVRRRAKLRAAGERLAGAMQRIGELSREAGLSRPPRLLLRPAGQRDAFVFGLPWRYYLVLPTAMVVRWRNRGLFDPVVRHELAHLRRHDVQLATAVWIAAVPVLLAPIVGAAATWDLSLIPMYLWRVALVMGGLWLVRRQVLRSREYGADLRAARQSGYWRPLSTVLQHATNQRGGRWRQFLSHHPTVAQRLGVLADPGRVRGASFADGLASAFLAAIFLPLLHNTLQVLTTGTPLFSWTSQIAAIVVGPFIGLAIVLGPLLGPLFHLILVPLAVACAALVWRRRVLPVPRWLIDDERTAWPAAAREPGLGFALLTGVASGALAAIGVTVYRLVAGKPVSDEDSIGRYLLWLLTAVAVALVVSFVTLVLVPRSGAAVGLVTGVSAAAAGGLFINVLNTFAFGNILDLRFWLSTMEAMVALWLFGYLLLLPLTLATWPLPWRDVPGRLLTTLSVIGAGLATLCVVGPALTLREV
ncbi:M48 family metalloprotease [Allorhizocola rhizosphaerae]|uniref:M48 family metalloprotease n=1 Tax=Allorhizocola rhizosphaerae TaxID=1872709 RepID=UPI0013C31615|nr:M48 family metalloprotease [Allorhizocola rhizosphaerae]